MLANSIPELPQANITDLIIPASNVAHVQLGNSLQHALLVLIKSGYSVIPVLDMEYRIHGLLSTTVIVESILGIERIEYEKLDDRKVEDVMIHKIPRISDQGDFLRALELSINHPFICVENEDGVFVGILTRRSILAELYRHARGIE
ncbi:cyclic-di-AMP-binding protein CbpB [Brevibacillus sp. SYSU BS000544]|uniref:cyclic-di-AMP-binding protein CbpB n=1 Tax=Brevibacillus sp. SYSU BS000544 TaxID=3416443 RepID=UPI003CE54FE2